MIKNKDMDTINGGMEILIKDIGIKEKDVEMVNIFGQMEIDIQVNGKMTKEMDKVNKIKI